MVSWSEVGIAVSLAQSQLKHAVDAVSLARSQLRRWPVPVSFEREDAIS